MVTVKKEGSVPIDWKAEVTCKKDDEHDKNEPCGASLEVTEKDLVLRYWEGTHFRHYYPAIKCPCCGKYNRVKVPSKIWEEINTAKYRVHAIFDGLSESIH